MTEKELFIKNNILQTEFSRYLIEHPEVAGMLPPHAEVVILPEDDPALAKKNEALARAQRENDDRLVFVRVERMEPQRSRLVNPRIRTDKTI
jgi:hypothetical protein